MKEIIIKEAALQEAAKKGMDEFVQVFVGAIYDGIGGELNADTMGSLNAHQITLLAYQILRDEVMDGGFVQLIHNGYGNFIFHNPFAKMLKIWGLNDLSKLIYNAYRPYAAKHEEIEQDCTEEEFMQLFEKNPEFDDFDDEFVENEEAWTSAVAYYLDDHIEQFAKIEKA